MTIETGELKRTRGWNLFLAALGSSLLIAGCEKKQQAVAPPPPEVATIVATLTNVELTTELPGRTSPFRIAEVRPQVNGLIQKRLFKEGSDVNEGAPLYQIDPAPFEAALANAKAALARAEANVPAAKVRVDRYKLALEQRAVSQQDYDDAAAAFKQATADVEFYKAAVQTAQINLGYAQVRAPIQGRIGPSAATEGAIVTAYQPTPLATIQQLDPIYVDVPQSATDLLRLEEKLKKGIVSRNDTNVNEVALFLPDGRRYSGMGTLQFRDVSVDPTTGSIILRMVFPNPDRVLLPGMFVRAVVTEGSDKKAMLIPQQAVSRDPKGNPLALVIEEGKAQMRMLQLDRAIKDNWLVTSGIKPGDHVVIEGMQKVRPGMGVREVPAGSTQTNAVAGAATQPAK